MHNKSYALKLIQDKQNGLNNYSYSLYHRLRWYSYSLLTASLLLIFTITKIIFSVSDKDTAIHNIKISDTKYLSISLKRRRNKRIK